MTTRKTNDAAFVPIHPPGGCPLVGQPLQDPSLLSFSSSYQLVKLDPMFALDVSPLTVSLS
jgi:hypothetical protein